MTSPVKAALWFDRRAGLSEGRLAALRRETEAGNLVISHVGGEDASLPALPWAAERTDARALCDCGADIVFHFEAAPSAVAGSHGKDRLKRLLPAGVLALGRRADILLRSEQKYRPWRDFDGWGKPLPREERVSHGAFDPLSGQLDANRLIPARVLDVPGFRLDDYLRLRREGISFVSDNCWGGLMYNTLGLEMRSPFINMFIRREHFARLLRDLPGYLAQPLVPLRLRQGQLGSTVYPIAALGDVEIHLNHVFTPAQLQDYARAWYRRTDRFLFDRVMVQTNFETPAIWQRDREAFAALPWPKIAFTPFEVESEAGDVVYLDCVDQFKDGIAECSRALAKNALPSPIPYDFLDTYLNLKLSPPRE